MYSPGQFRASVLPSACHSADGRCRGGSRSTVWRGPYGERGARAYNGGLGVVPPAGSRGRAPGQGVRGRSPPEAERLLVLSYVWNGAKLLCLWAVLWSLMVAAVPTCIRGSWVLIFHPWFGGGGMAPWPPLWIRPCVILRSTVLIHACDWQRQTEVHVSNRVTAYTALTYSVAR